MLGADLAGEVTTPEPYVVPAVGERRFTVAALDLGIKASTPRYLAERGCDVHVMPASSTADDLLATDADGIFFSNGPGDPATADGPVAALRGVLGVKPVFGICFGNQVLGRALGFGTYKLRFGHRGVNQPVQDRAHRSRRRSPATTTGSPSTRRWTAPPTRRTARWRSATSTSTTVWWRGCAAWRCRRSPCSTTPRRRPARTTRSALFDSFADLMAAHR